MINPVDNRNSYTGAYERGGKKAARIEGEAPAFLLPDDGGVIWDRSSAGSKKNAPKQKAKKEEFQAAKAEPRAKTEKTQDKALAGAEEKAPQPGFFSRVASFFKDLLSRLWYGDDSKKEEEKENAGSTVKALSAEDTAEKDAPQDREQRIRDLIAKKDSKGLERELTEDGKKKPARNTGLLTYYDRFGRIVKARDTEATAMLKSSKAKGSVEQRPQGNYRRYI